MNFSLWLPRFCADTTREGGPNDTRFSMNRRDMMKLASLVMLPMMPGTAKAGSDGKAPPPLRYKVFTVTRPGLNRDVPPGKEPRMWVANSSTLIYGEQDAVLVDTFLTVEQCNGLADAIVASDAESSLCHSCPWRSFLRDKGFAGSFPKPESIIDT
jgi:hypothetical protein